MISSSYRDNIQPFPSLRTMVMTINEQQRNLIDQFLRNIEPDQKVLLDDLKHLAAYLIKVGTNVTIIRGTRFARQKLTRHKEELDPKQIIRLIAKYKLTWSRDCERFRFDPERNRNLYHIAHHHPDVFLQVAGQLTPGGYDHRRFWWCANNYHFYLENWEQNSKLTTTTTNKHRYPIGLLLSDVLCHFLNIDDEKLIAISALHLSIKHSEAKIHLDWYERNRQCILNRIRLNEFGLKHAKLREKLRTFYMIEEIQKQLATIHVDHFIEWWNLTGLTWPTIPNRRTQHSYNEAHHHYHHHHNHMIEQNLVA